jgi:hypothetical protein
MVRGEVDTSSRHTDGRSAFTRTKVAREFPRALPPHACCLSSARIRPSSNVATSKTSADSPQVVASKTFKTHSLVGGTRSAETALLAAKDDHMHIFDILKPELIARGEEIRIYYSCLSELHALLQLPTVINTIPGLAF